MAGLNFHHLQYFWAVAREGHLTRAAARLNVSQSALSTQIRRLEADLGTPLFRREGRTLVLTEAGQIALAYADTIFSTGSELVAHLRQGLGPRLQVLRIGAVATLSRNFQENFVRPLLGRGDVQFVLQSGGLDDLLARLRVHSLDLVLSNQRVEPSEADRWRCRRVARQPVGLVGRPRRGRRRAFRIPDDLADAPLLLPGPGSGVRAAFDRLCERAGIRYLLRAEVDDMALLRLLARDSDAFALVPTVVVQDELKAGRLVQIAVVPDLFENFYAITLQRRFEPPLVKELLGRTEEEVLESGS